MVRDWDFRAAKVVPFSYAPPVSMIFQCRNMRNNSIV